MVAVVMVVVAPVAVAVPVAAVELSKNVAEASLLIDLVGVMTRGGEERSTPDVDVFTGVKLITKTFFLPSFFLLSVCFCLSSFKNNNRRRPEIVFFFKIYIVSTLTPPSAVEPVLFLVASIEKRKRSLDDVKEGVIP